MGLLLLLLLPHPLLHHLRVQSHGGNVTYAAHIIELCTTHAARTATMHATCHSLVLLREEHIPLLRGQASSSDICIHSWVHSCTHTHHTLRSELRLNRRHSTDICLLTLLTHHIRIHSTPTHST
jgi:hypothetical protein